MKKLTLFTIFICLSFEIYSQSTDYAIITVYRDNDVYSNNKIAKLFINDRLRIGLKGGSFDTLRVNPDCYTLRTNRNKEQYKLCFEANKTYFLKIDYKYIFLFGKFNLLEITEKFALEELKDKKFKKESYKK